MLGHKTDKVVISMKITDLSCILYRIFQVMKFSKHRVFIQYDYFRNLLIQFAMVLCSKY